MMTYLFKRNSISVLIPIGILLFLLTACQKDSIDELTTTSTAATENETTSPKAYPNVAEELWPYFQQFEIAAAAQGITVDLIEEGITGVIEDLEEANVAGQCNFYSHSPNHVIIDATFWRRASDNFREMIIFHELGHCSLERGHREGQLESGNCISIMRSGIEPCRDAYGTTTKAYYLKELFHPESID